MAKEKRVIANTKSALIEAVLTHRFCFSKQTDAIAKIAFLKNHFITTPNLLPESPEDIVLWIKGYALDETQIEGGRTGNFARVTWKEAEKGKFTLTMQKLDISLDKHPQRKKMNHPDWGHYLLRSSQKGQLHYASLAEANNALQHMATTYPKACVLATNKLHVQVYKNKGKNQNALESMTLETEATPGGGFSITCKPNTYVRKQKIDAPKEVLGEFSARILKRP